MRTWTRPIFGVLLAIPFLCSPVRADPELNAKKIEDLQKQMKDLQDDVKKLKEDMISNGSRGNRIEGQLSEILRRLDGLAQQQQTIQRIAGYAPPTGPGNAPLPAAATIIVDNQFPGDAQVNINGQSYIVHAFQKIRVAGVPTGSFQYSVDVNGQLVQPPRVESLLPTGYTIRVYQRPF